MALSITHPFTSAKADGTDATLVQPSNWNANHTITMAAGTILGRDTSGSGAAQELPIQISTSGFLGVGGYPNVQFEATATGDAQLRLYETGAGIDMRLVSVAGAAQAGLLGTYSNHPVVVYQNGTERVRIDTSGNVGINGTAGASYKLDVNGAANATTLFKKGVSVLHAGQAYALSRGFDMP